MSGGFTLVELIAVMVIVGVMAGVALPSLTSLGAGRSRMAGRQIQRDMTFARQRALATGTVTWVTFNTGSDTWSVLAEDPANPGRANAIVINDMATGRAYTTSLGMNEYVGVSFTSCNFGGGTEVGFDWLGKPLISSGAGLASQGSVVLSGGNSVTVESGTGYIRYVP